MAAKDPGYRRLAAIMFLDMVGYSAVSHRDEALAQALLTALKQIVRTQLTRFDGREIRTMGDGFLVEFASAVAAVHCAVEIQRAIHARNVPQPAAQQFHVRIGIHLGDVVCEGDDILGDGVNIAARVEPLAAPGGICVTQQVFDQLRSHVDLILVAMGEARLKNIQTPIAVFQIPPPGADRHWHPQRLSRVSAVRKLVLAITVGVIVAAGFWAWRGHEAGGGAGHQHLVILPFRSVTPGETNQALGDGFVETLAARLTALQTRAPNLRVVPMSEVRREHIAGISEARSAFGATRILLGSVERNGEAIRINMALVDARTQTQLHACTTNGLIGNLFAIQDGIAELASAWLDAASLEALTAAAGPAVKPTSAYEYYLMGVGKLARFDRAENIDPAINYFQQSLAFDEGFAAARAGLAEAYWFKYKTGRRPEWLTEAQRQAMHALSLNTNLARAWIVLGNIALQGSAPLAEAIRDYERALALDPFDADAWACLAAAYQRSDQRFQAFAALNRALERNPKHWAVYNRLGKTYHDLGRLPEAADYFRQAIALAPDSYMMYYNLGAVYIEMGRFAEAEKAIERSLALRKTPEAYSNLGTAFFYQHKYREAMDNYLKATAEGTATHEWWGNLGDACHWVPGAEERGKAAYGKACELAESDLLVRPADAATLSYLAWYLLALHQDAAASNHLERALKLAPEGGEVLFNAALIAEVRGQRSNALAFLALARSNGFPQTIVQQHPVFDKLRQDMLRSPR